MPGTDKEKDRLCRGTGRNIGRLVLVVFAALFALQAASAMSDFPQELLKEWLSGAGVEELSQVQHVVVIGGTVPSAAGLMHSYYAAEFGRNRPGAKYIIALPINNDLDYSNAERMRDELILRGIPHSDIIFESKGLNTYQQSVYIRQMLEDDGVDKSLLIVTSPLHVRRAFLCFCKQGFTQVKCLPAFEASLEVDLGPLTFIRYTLWYRLECQALIARELTALAVYKLKGWI